MRSCILGFFLMALPAWMYAQVDSIHHEKVLFKEEFNEDTGAWPKVNHGDTAFIQIKDGHYILNNNKTNRFWAYRLGIISGLTEQPNVLEMRMKITSDSSPIAYGMIWNTVKRADNFFNENAFLISTIKKYGLFVKKGEPSDAIKDWTFCDCVKVNDYNVLRIEQAADGMHAFYINNQLVSKNKMPQTSFAFGFYCDPHTILSIDYILMAVKK